MDPARPYTLIAELTYRCPLRCTYCSNPVALGSKADEIGTDVWLRTLTGAERLGVMQVHFTGGEPLLRPDLELFVARARALELYTNLITSGVPLSRERLRALAASGLDNVQLSFQATGEHVAERVAGVRVHQDKLDVAEWVKSEGLALTMNVVLHRHNIEEIEALVDLARRLGVDRLELANTQYHGWALQNRDALLPTRAQLEHATAVALTAKTALAGTIEVVYVMPDYFSDKPKACMDGWARRFVTVTPNGVVLPCHAAQGIAGLTFESVQARPLEDIWASSPGLDAFRGLDWMTEPCRSCPRKEIDFGGCRCQAFQLTGDARATDPACALSPEHGRVVEARASVERAVAEGRASSVVPVYRLMRGATRPR
jgi:pyrroloquinoline quinone biosynthesis protein E